MRKEKKSKPRQIDLENFIMELKDEANSIYWFEKNDEDL